MSPQEKLKKDRYYLLTLYDNMYARYKRKQVIKNVLIFGLILLAAILHKDVIWITLKKLSIYFSN